ncbi:MAG: DNA polymerase III subunit gamma/tau [Chloroflexi bacterium]|nr:DNA polymerase III subunit gamma/tau [Chloroflexota bacterium]
MCASILAGDSLRALYNKYRPQRFADVAGQRHVVRILQNALVHKRVSHAYLFSGERGTGKTTVGRILAKALNCQRGIQPEPCNDCEHCRSVGNESFLDLIEIDAASHTSVNDIRDLREKVRYRPASGRYKVYLIDEVHQLSRSAYNAFLKTLEEPPDHAVFILATTDPHRVLPTVRSRCQHLRFKRIDHAQMIGQLERIVGLEEAMADDQALALIARNAEGSLRDALGLLEQGLAYAENRLTERQMRELLGTAGYEGVSIVAAAIARGSVGDAMTALAQSIDDGADPTALHRQLVGFFRAVLMLLTSRNESILGQYSADELAVLREVANKFARIRQPLAVVEALTERPPLTAARPPQLDLELAIVQAALATGAEDALQPLPAVEAPAVNTAAPSDPAPVAEPETTTRPAPSPTAESDPATGPEPLPESLGNADTESVPEPQADADKDPASANESAPEEIPTPAVGDSDVLMRFEAARESFVALVRDWDPTVQSQFIAAPARLDGDTLVLGIEKEFTLKRLTDPSKHARLAQFAQTALGEPVELRLEHVPSDSGGEAYTARIARAAGELLGAREIKDV